MGFRVLPPAEKVATRAEADACLKRLDKKMLVAFDTETTGLVRHKDYAVLGSLSDGVGRWAIWPQALMYFEEFLQNPERKLIGHNANFDQWMLLNIGIDLDKYVPRNKARVIDTMVMHALIDDAAPHDLKYLSRLFLDIDMVPFKQLYGKQMRTRTNADIFLDPKNEAVTVNYSALDAYSTYKLFIVLQQLLQKEKITDVGSPYTDLWNYYTRTEVMFTKVLWHMERNGVKLNVDTLLDKAPVMEIELLQINRWFCHKLRRYDVNLNSLPQMCDLFFKKLGYKPVTFTESGAPQLSMVFLKAAAKAGCEYATNLLRFRQVSKKLGTYVVGLLDCVGFDGRVHTTFKQTGARTGRLSSNEPNMQNVPGDLRDSYEAADGYVLLATDQQQLEMRILAHVSQDPTLCDAVRTGKDVHCATAATMYHRKYEDVAAAKAKDDAGLPLTDEDKVFLGERKKSKTIGFGLVYGMGPAKLASQLGCTKQEAQDIIAAYFAALPGVPTYFQNKVEAAKIGYTTTALGRRRQAPGITSLLSGEQAKAVRLVKNSPIQGFASELLKLAMNAIFTDPFIEATGTRMLIQVHDELVFEIPKSQIDNPKLHERIKHHMTQSSGLALNVPLDTSTKYGHLWSNCK